MELLRRCHYFCGAFLPFLKLLQVNIKVFSGGGLFGFQLFCSRPFQHPCLNGERNDKLETTCSKAVTFEETKCVKRITIDNVLGVQFQDVSISADFGRCFSKSSPHRAQVGASCARVGVEFLPVGNRHS